MTKAPTQGAEAVAAEGERNTGGDSWPEPEGGYVATEAIADPLSDNQVRAAGYEPGPRGWRPTRPSADVPDTPELVGRLVDERANLQLPEPVDQVRRFGSAARRIAEDPVLDPRTKVELTKLLIEQAKSADLPDWAMRAVVAEHLATMYPSQGWEIPAPSFEHAHRRLNALGFRRCPTCDCTVADALELERWRRRRQWAEEDARIREEALD